MRKSLLPASSRRTALRALLLPMLSTSLTALAAPKRYPLLRLSGPSAVVSFPLLHIIDSGALSAVADKVEFRPWQSVDQLRALLTSGAIDFTATPSNLPALMANKGEAVRLLNIGVWGIQWLVSRDPKVTCLEDLKGEELLVGYQRDLPAIALDKMLQAKQMQPGRDIRLRYVRDSQDAIALLLSGQARHAILGEPTTSLLLWRNRQQGGAPLYRAQSQHQMWRETFPAQPEFPTAGIMAAATLSHDRALSRAVDSAYATSTRWCVANPAECAKLVLRQFPHLPAAAVEESIRHTQLDSRSAASVRPQLEALYKLLAESNPQATGGRLPDAGFYGP